MLKPESIVRHLRSYQRRSRDAVVDDFETYMVVQRLLQLAVQCVVDLSSHIQVALDLEPVDDYEQAILSLGRHGILPRDFAERICKMAGFRYIYDFLRRGGYLDAET